MRGAGRGARSSGRQSVSGGVGGAANESAVLRPTAANAPGPDTPDPRNRLNDLTGREWLYFQSSVVTTAYPVSGPGSYGHNLRRAHPSPKPPQLMASLIGFIPRRGDRVLDPFA